MTNKKITELVLAGSAHRGVSYIGALCKLEEFGLLEVGSLKKVVGVSMGSLVGSLYISRKPLNKILDVFLSINFNQMISDIKSPQTQTQIHIDNQETNNQETIKSIHIIESSVLKKWISFVIKEIYETEELTLRELYEKTNIYFIVSCINYHKGIEYICHKTNPNYKLVDVICASMSMPFVFEPTKIESNYYIDSGFMENIPMHLVGPFALGLVTTRNTSPDNYIDWLFKIFHEYINKKLKSQDYEQYLLRIPVIDSFIRFNLNKNDIINLYKIGYNYINGSEDIHKILNKIKFKSVVQELKESFVIPPPQTNNWL